MKKQTNWITIPDEKIHTPVSGQTETRKDAKKSGDRPVTNKILWGMGFVVLVFTAFALLAPGQFSALLKGSLFDTAGVSEDQLKIDLIPDKTEKTDTTATTEGATGEIAAAAAQTDESNGTAEVGTGNGTPETAPGTSDQSENVVKPEEEPVSISVTPVTPTAEPEDCVKDMACFSGYLKDSSLAKVTYGYKISNKDFESDLEITGAEGDNCLFTAKFTKSPEAKLVDQIADCKLKKGDYKEEDINKIFSNKDELSKTCTGDAVDTLGKYIDSLGASASAATTPAATTPAAVTDEQAKLIADLKKQIDQLQIQRKNDAKTMQDIVNEAAEQTIHAAASESTAPTSITSTTAIGQPQTLQPGFRVNPYRVTVTPQQMLQQNLGQGGQYAQQNAVYSQTGYQQNYQQAYQPGAAYQQSVVTSGATPQTGPSEILFITFVLTFLGLVGWKFMRAFA